MQPARAIPLDPAVRMAASFQNTTTPGINPAAPPPLAGQGSFEADMTPEQRTQFQAYIESMPPEERAAFIQRVATEYGSVAGDAQKDMTRADALRQGTPRGRQAGGMYVAANPLEHIAQVMNNKKREGEYGVSKGERGAAREGQTQRTEDRLNMTLSDILRQR